MRKNKKGFSTLIALVIVVIVFVISGIVQLTLSSTANGQKISQRRFEMSIIENTIRFELKKPDTYTLCALDSVTNKWSCQINPTTLPRFQMPMTGITCDTPPCGITSSISVIPHATQPEAKVIISYNGKDVRIKNMEFNVSIPKEALTSKLGVCGSDKNNDGIIDGYLYKGILADGSDDCRPLPSCADNQYFVGMNNDGTAKCSNIITSKLTDEGSGVYSLSCATSPKQKYLNQVSFNPGDAHPIDISCQDRIDPCEVQGNTSCPGL